MTQQQDQSGTPSGQENTGSEAAPGGRRDGGAASADMEPIGMESASGSPATPASGPSGPAANGSFGSGTYNGQGRVVGPDSPAGAEAGLDAGGEGQGDDLANRLGGDAARGAGMTGAAAVTGDIEAGRSERDEAPAAGAAGAGGPDAGSPGGMGGARARGGIGAGRPPGGVSPIADSPLDQD